MPKYGIIACGLVPVYTNVCPPVTFMERMRASIWPFHVRPYIASINGNIYVSSDTHDWEGLMADIGKRIIPGVIITKWVEWSSAPGYLGETEKAFRVVEFEEVRHPHAPVKVSYSH